MGYDKWWKTLESLITELRSKKISIPKDVMTSLRSAKTMIKVYNADLSYVESTPSIENYLMTVESSLINIVKETSGLALTEAWMRKLEEARKDPEPKTQAMPS